ncbi:hypothetical protein EBU95_14280 [bacterium]|nr:hypothetical protein [bacterium]
MGRYVDNFIAFRILKLLVTPFKDTDAYKLGIIDDKGKELKQMSSLNSDTELNAYTLLHRLVFRIKRIIEKVPIENKKIVSYAAALALIRESMHKHEEPLNLEIMYINKLEERLQDEKNLVESFLTEKRIFTFKQFREDAPANAIAATPGISVPEGKPLFGKKLQRRKSNA